MIIPMEKCFPNFSCDILNAWKNCGNTRSNFEAVGGRDDNIVRPGDPYEQFRSRRMCQDSKSGG